MPAIHRRRPHDLARAIAPALLLALLPLSPAARAQAPDDAFAAALPAVCAGAAAAEALGHTAGSAGAAGGLLGE